MRENEKKIKNKKRQLFKQNASKMYPNVIQADVKAQILYANGFTTKLGNGALILSNRKMLLFKGKRVILFEKRTPKYWIRSFRYPLREKSFILTISSLFILSSRSFPDDSYALRVKSVQSNASRAHNPSKKQDHRVWVSGFSFIVIQSNPIYKRRKNTLVHDHWKHTIIIKYFIMSEFIYLFACKRNLILTSTKNKYI